MDRLGNRVGKVKTMTRHPREVSDGSGKLRGWVFTTVPITPTVRTTLTLFCSTSCKPSNSVVVGYSPQHVRRLPESRGTECTTFSFFLQLTLLTRDPDEGEK